MVTNIEPYTFIDWLKDFCDQLDCPKPDENDYLVQDYQEKLGAWETQQLILKKLRFAIEVEEGNLKYDHNR